MALPEPAKGSPLAGWQYLLPRFARLDRYAERTTGTKFAFRAA
jgi:hypothetical protein